MVEPLIDKPEAAIKAVVSSRLSPEQRYFTFRAEAMRGSPAPSNLQGRLEIGQLPSDCPPPAGAGEVRQLAGLSDNIQLSRGT
jgi:hypothetical protein